MLTNEDIRMMGEWRDEILKERRREITLIYFEEVKDEYTGEVIRTEKVEKDIMSVVTNIAGKTPDYSLKDGIRYDDGDIWFSLKIKDVEDIADKITQVQHDGKDYEILAMDKKGIGMRNRYEVLGRAIT